MRIVIVGAGQAGLQTAVSLARGGFQGRVILLGKEPHPPYQRPPLSKQLLKGEWDAQRCQLRGADSLEDLGIDFRPGTEAVALDCKRQQLTLTGERVIDYDRLVICSGARPRRLHFTDTGITGVHRLRTLEHAAALKERLAAGVRLVVAGGGFIGLEVAATARALGCEVDVIEPQERLMARSTLRPIGDWFLQRHREAGVKVHIGRLMTEILGGDRLRAVALDDGTLIETDLLLEGIGVNPELSWLEGSGVATHRGVLVDERCRTSVEGVYAAGDVCELRHPLLEGPSLLESVQNAVSQGKIVAANLLGEAREYTDVPWFWSEQHGERLQMAGLPRDGDDIVIRTADPHSMTVLSLGPDRLHAVQCINAPKDYMTGRKLIAAGPKDKLQELKAPSVGMEELL